MNLVFKDGGMPQRLIAIDPGTRSAGVAYFLEGTLVQLNRLQNIGFGDVPTYDVADSDVLVIETPESYPNSPVNPNDLITLALQAGALSKAFPAKRVYSVKPKQWKGQVPKNISHERILTRLSVAEISLTKGHSHDELDAVGIGLWFLGRY